MTEKFQQSVTVFNSALETGVRSLVILTASFPRKLDLQRLVDFEYLALHSGDIDGPYSLHPPLPMREGELLVRRKVIEAGLSLMISRGLIKRLAENEGIVYQASDYAQLFVDSLTSTYMCLLIERATWVVTNFGNKDTKELHELISSFFDKWTTQFHSTQTLGGI